MTITGDIDRALVRARGLAAHTSEFIAGIVTLLRDAPVQPGEPESTFTIESRMFLKHPNLAHSISQALGEAHRETYLRERAGYLAQLSDLGQALERVAEQRDQQELRAGCLATAELVAVIAPIDISLTQVMDPPLEVLAWLRDVSGMAHLCAGSVVKRLGAWDEAMHTRFAQSATFIDRLWTLVLSDLGIERQETATP